MSMPDELSVLPERCIACGTCQRLAPHLFAIAGHRLAVPRAALVDGPDADEALETALACPTEAIQLRPSLQPAKNQR